MQKQKLAICMGEEEYCKRFVAYLMGHYRESFELYVFHAISQLLTNTKEVYAAIICADLAENIPELLQQRQEKVLYLCGTEDALLSAQEKIHSVDKFLEMPKIVEEIQKIVMEHDAVSGTFTGIKEGVLAAVYALSGNEYQLPFAMTLGAILGKKEKTIVIDLQENSGISTLGEWDRAYGLEDILIMTEGARFSKQKLISGIGHMEEVDFVFPAENSECLSEVTKSMLEKLIQILIQELGYQRIILNLGSRFVGFFQILQRCQNIYLLQKHSGISKWREKDFFLELDRRGEENLRGRMEKINVPVLQAPVTSCMRLIEQWKWSEFGDQIRRCASMEE